MRWRIGKLFSGESLVPFSQQDTNKQGFRSKPRSVCLRAQLFDLRVAPWQNAVMKQETKPKWTPPLKWHAPTTPQTIKYVLTDVMLPRAFPDSWLNPYESRMKALRTRRIYRFGVLVGDAWQRTFWRLSVRFWTLPGGKGPARNNLDF